jgi:hypothetical protein
MKPGLLAPRPSSLRALSTSRDDNTRWLQHHHPVPTRTGPLLRPLPLVAGALAALVVAAVVTYVYPHLVAAGAGPLLLGAAFWLAGTLLVVSAVTLIGAVVVKLAE